MTGKTDRKIPADILRIATLLAIFSLMALLLKRPDVRRLVFDIDSMRVMLQGGGGFLHRALSCAVFIAVAGGLITLGLPRLWVSAVAGIIYGALLGTVVSLIAALFGASANYITGRSVLAAVIERRVGARLKEWRSRFRGNAFWWVLYARFFPFSNSTVMSVLCGSCKVPFTPFITGSFIGFIPLTVVFAFYGSGGIKGNFRQIGFATILLIASIFSRKFMDRWFPSGVRK